MRICPQCRSLFPPEVEYCPTDGARIADEPVDPLLGTVIDNRYMLTERLGAGTSGAVYRAKHTVLAHEYAVKVLYGDLALNTTVVERFRREAQTISRLRHPNVVDIIDYGATGEGLIFLVLEMLRGKTLLDLIAREAPFELERAASIARQIALGLSEVHKFGFVHRDLKPGNVMILDDGKRETAKILDFGLVGKEERSENENRLTHHGVTVGTPLYMAPEQCMKADVSPRADLYSLGVILYEMIGGKRPFDGPVQTVIIAHMTERPKPLPRSGPLSDLAMQLLEKSALKRPPDAQAVVDMLDRAYPPEGAAPSGKWNDTLDAPEAPGGPDLLPDLPSWSQLTREDDPTRPGEPSRRASASDSGPSARVGDSKTVSDEINRFTVPADRNTTPESPADLGRTLLEGDDTDEEALRKRVGAAMAGRAPSGPTELPGALTPPHRPSAAKSARSSQRGELRADDLAETPREHARESLRATGGRGAAAVAEAPAPAVAPAPAKPVADRAEKPTALMARPSIGTATATAPAVADVVYASATVPAPSRAAVAAAEEAGKKKRLLLMFSAAALVTSMALVVLIATPALWPTIHVMSDPPGAAITVDGVATGLSTPGHVRLRPGVVHHIRVEAEGRRPEEIETVAMTRGQTGSHLVCIGDAERRVAISPAAGRVFVNGAAIGAGTELLLPRLPAGPVTIKVEAPGYRSWSHTFTTHAEIPATFDIALSKSP